MTENKPVGKYRKGQVTMTVWSNEREFDGNKVQVKSYQIEKSYKDGDEWKTTTSYNANDLNALLATITKALTDEVKNE